MLSTPRIDFILRECSSAVKTIILFDVQRQIKSAPEFAFQKAKKILAGRLRMLEAFNSKTQRVKNQQQKQESINSKRLSPEQQSKNHLRNMRSTARKKEWLNYEPQ